jgi:imidazolonepropionase-like amidohydrolase
VPTPFPPILLRDANAWDAGSRTFEAGIDLLFEGGRISGRGVGLPAPAGVRVFSCYGRYVLPGLIDCHVHLASGGGPNELNAIRGMPAAALALRAAKHAESTVRAGFTTVRDLGAPERVNIHVANAIADGTVTGPRMLAAGLGVTMTGGHGHGFIAREADGPDEVRKAVREQLRAGATAIKLFASGGVLTPGVDPRSPSFTEAELAAGVEEAHKAFRPAAAHAQSTEGIKNAIRAGIDSIEHGVWLDEEAIALMCERGTYLVPTLTAPSAMAAGGEAAGIERSAVEKSNIVLEDHIASYEAAVRAGVRVAMGTDQGTPLSRPGENAQEILLTARHGLSNATAILSATAWAADLLRLDTGILDVGRPADAVLFDGDPLAELSVLAQPSRIGLVIAAGRVVRHEPKLLEETTS